MTAPSIKEALEPFSRIPLAHTDDIDDSAIVFEYEGGAITLGDLRRVHAALATLKPSGERREAIARIIDPAAFGHVTGRETASWRAWNDSRNALALKTADRILASVLVQDGPTTSKKEVVEGEKREALQQLIMKSQDCGYGDEDTNGKHRRMFCDDDSLSSYHRSAKCDCRAVFDAILASGLVQDEAGWRDISTAPKDGTVIDVWLGDADGSDLDFYCQSRTCKRSANWYWSNGKFRPFTGWDLPLTTFVEPTHWIPLPAPPIRSARNGGAET